MPAKSRKQQRYLAMRFGAAWLRRHHFNNRKIPKRRKKKKR